VLAGIVLAAAVVTTPYDSAVATLAQPRATPPEYFRRLFLQMWAQVPNWRAADPMWIMRPEPRWTPPPRVPGQPRAKRPPPHDPETLDWLTALRGLDLDAPELYAPVVTAPPLDIARPGAEVRQPPAPLATPTRADFERARAEAIELVAAMRTVAASKQLDAVAPLFALAFEYEGVFRDECGRQIRSMESYAVPALIRFMYGKRPAKQRRYASYQLDRMDRARPMKALSTAPDDRVRAEIVHAYGEEHALDAVEAILNQVDSPSHRVRREARWAWLRYVTGKPPPPAPKRKRKLPGGREEEEEKPDYLTYREIADLAIRKQIEAINGEPPAAKATPAELTDELFAYYDKKRASEWDALFTGAQAKAAAGDAHGAVDDFGWILAHDPNYARRGEMAGAFVAHADALKAAGKLGEALGYYRQAVDLDPAGATAARAGARVALCDGLAGLARGHADEHAFQRALALDPSLDEARSGLSRAGWLRLRARLLQLAVVAACGFALAFALWLLWRRAAPPRAS
jgi:hypothetical protein